jgi:hypothetical protein
MSQIADRFDRESKIREGRLNGTVEEPQDGPEEYLNDTALSVSPV